MKENKSVYNHPDIINFYARQHDLFQVEQLLYSTILKSSIQNGSTLDIGIGGGRTTNHFLKYAKKYVGIDYIESFVKSLLKKYPQADLRTVDARDLSVFDAFSFDLVNFSLNGIDYTDYDGRKKILLEIHRVLKQNGYFFFSTHNMDFAKQAAKPWLNKKLDLIIRIKTFLKLMFWWPRHNAMMKNEVHEKDYAIINDCAHNFQLMTFYSKSNFVIDQLKSIGFEKIYFYNKKGEVILNNQFEEWFFILCQKK